MISAEASILHRLWQEVRNDTTYVKYVLEWFSPVTNQPLSYRSTLPIKFGITDFAGNFVEDTNVAVQVTDGVNSTSVFSTVKGNIYIKISESHYLVNLSLKDYLWITSGSSYQIRLRFGDVHLSSLLLCRCSIIFGGDRMF